jgi:ABC-type branched-subunit amino acid transport system substrate-binding protein
MSLSSPSRRRGLRALAAAALPLTRPVSLAGALALAGPARAQSATVSVGMVAPFSGPQGVTGRAMLAGARLALEAQNARGGVRGQKLQLVTRDDAQKPDETVRLVRELVEQVRPVALLGTVGTSNLEALAKDGTLQRLRVPMVGAVSGAHSVTSVNGFYVVKASYREEVDRLFSQLAQLGQRRVGLVYQDDGLGRDVLTGAELSAPRHGLTLGARAGYPRNTVEVGAAVEAMVKAAPQVIFLGATTAAAIEFMKRYHAAGGRATLYGLSIIDTEAVLRGLGPERARGFAFSVVLPLAGQTDLPVVREYLALRAASRDADLSARSIEGYIAARALIRALEKAGRAEPEAVQAALSTPMDLGGYVLDFGTGGRPGSRWVDFAMFGTGGRVVQ